MERSGGGLNQLLTHPTAEDGEVAVDRVEASSRGVPAISAAGVVRKRVPTSELSIFGVHSEDLAS